jgi:hypothetical protein
MGATQAHDRKKRDPGSEAGVTVMVEVLVLAD